MVVVRPTALVNYAGFKPGDDLPSRPWKKLDGYVLVEIPGGRTQNIERSILDRLHATAAMMDGGLGSICVSCHEALHTASIRAAATNSLARLGALRLLVNKVLPIFSSHVEWTEFRLGTTIEEDRLPHLDYAPMLICDAARLAGTTGTVEHWHSFARDDYALSIKGHVHREMLREDVSDGLESAVAVISDLGLFATELHVAQSAFSFRSLAGDFFIDAWIDAGYRR